MSLRGAKPSTVPSCDKAISRNEGKFAVAKKSLTPFYVY